MTEPTQTASWRRVVAAGWYFWGLSWCHWGLRTSESWCFRAGVRAFDRALRAAPGYALAYYRRGLIRGRELGEPREAIADLSKAIALDPEWAEPYLQRGLFYRFQGDSRAALDDLRRFVALAAGSSWLGEAEAQIAAIEADLDG